MSIEAILSAYHTHTHARTHAGTHARTHTHSEREKGGGGGVPAHTSILTNLSSIHTALNWQQTERWMKTAARVRCKGT